MQCVDVILASYEEIEVGLKLAIASVMTKTTKTTTQTTTTKIPAFVYDENSALTYDEQFEMYEEAVRQASYRTAKRNGR
jgi:hypothetical protein